MFNNITQVGDPNCSDDVVHSGIYARLVKSYNYIYGTRYKISLVKPTDEEIFVPKREGIMHCGSNVDKKKL